MLSGEIITPAALLLTAALLSGLSGVPLLIPFVPVAAGQTIATIFIGFVYYGTGMVFGEPSRHYVKREGVSISLIVLALLLTMLLILGTTMPTIIYDFIMRAATVIQA